MKKIFNLLLLIFVRNKKIIILASVLLLLIIFIVLLRMYFNKQYNITMIKKIESFNARCGYSYHGAVSQKILVINYVDEFNFREIIRLLPLIQEPFSISFSGGATLTQNDIDILAQTPHVTEIDLIECKFYPDDLILKKLAFCKKLKIIGLTCRDSSMSLPIKAICSLPQITTLGIIASKVSADDFEHVINLPLIGLDMTASFISNDHILTILKCNSLEYLTLYKCSFTDIASVRMLTKMKKIKLINLSGCAIPVKILDAFIDHQSLEEIIIDRTKLCEDDINLIKAYSRKLPKIKGTAIQITNNISDQH
ncbi:MAG: hypothetical protein LBC74_16200 [Planctomycetaceae bacterium]|jgi:hypothetical protein|nr:hypothetical protein [Planctomycetaceae bacterium]